MKAKLLNNYLSYKRLQAVYCARRNEFMERVSAETAQDYAGVILDLGLVKASKLFAMGHEAFVEAHMKERQGIEAATQQA